jgi:hypothetical protein
MPRRRRLDRRARGLAALVLVFVTATARAVTPTPAAGAEVEAPPRLSLPTEADRDAWLRDGFRLALGLHYGAMFGVAGPPDARVLGATLRVGLRLDADWSLLASFQYSVMSRGLTGLRFSGTLDPTWHATRHLSLAVGLGFAGISGGSTGGPDLAPLPNTLHASYTFPTANPPMPTCSGGGVAALVRAEWVAILGSRSATTFGIEGFGQWTTCEEDTGVVDLDTGLSIVRRQAWPHLGVTGTWGITWR